MDMNAMKGTQSIAFSESPYLVSAGSVAGKKEGEGPLGKYFDIASEDDLFGEKTWELAEGTMQKLACKLALKNAGVQPEEVRYLFGGDLLRQGIATSMGAEELQIPVFGLFGACSTSGEALALAAMTVAAGYGDLVLAATSSHFGSAEKEFRFPLGYGNQRPLSATWTVTGAGACILGYEPPPRPDNKTLNTLRNRNICAVITGITTGRLIDFGFRDSLNMGACMAPAACDTIARNLQDFHRKPSDYDAIFTGDLGMVGQTILFDLLTEKGFDISSVHQDCGMLIYDPQTQDTHSGGSGCGCAASVLAGYILPGIIQKKWKRILFVPTGALLSKVSFNEGDPIPGIAHAVVIEQYRVPDMM